MPLFDAASGSFVNPGSSLTVSHTCAGTDRALIVGVVGHDASDAITGVTYASVSMTLVHKFRIGTWRWAYVFALLAPATGANNIVVSASSSVFIEANSASYTGVSQTSQPEAFNTAQGNTASLSGSVTTLTDNAWVVALFAQRSGSITAGASTTLRNTALVGSIVDSGGPVSPAGSRTLVGNGGSVEASGMILVSLAPVSSDTITISTPAQYKVHQRSGTTGPISISGTYTGTPTSIEASFNGGAYSTIVASPAGGTYSGTLTGQAQGQGALTVRFSNQTSVNASVADVGIGDVFVVGGDSISEGRGTNAQSYTHANLKAAKFTQADAWGNGNDGIDTGTTNGSHWPLLATQIMASQGVPVAFISCGTGSTDIAGTNNQWAKNNSGYAGMTQQVTDSGVNAVKAVLLHLGPNAVVNATTISKATYNAALDQFAADIATDIAGAPKLHLGVFGEVSTGTPPDRRAALDNMRGAIIEAHGDNANIKPGPCLIDLNYSDGVHPQTDADLATVAKRWWVALAESLYAGSGGRGPRVSFARWNEARNVLRVKFDRALKTGLTHSTAAWIVTDNGAAMTVTGVAYHGTDSASLLITTSAAATGPAGSTTVTFASGDDAVGLVVPQSADIAMPSGAAIQIPAEPVYARSAAEVPRITITLTTDGSTPAASQSSLKWAWFDQVTPDLFAAPTDKGAAETTNGSGVIDIPLPNTDRAVGEVGWLIVTNSDGTTTQSPAHKAFSGPVQVA